MRRIRNVLSGTATSAILALAAIQTPAFAQATPQPTGPDAPLTPAPVELTPIIIEASRIGTVGPGVSATGANDYGITTTEIENLPNGVNTACPLGHSWLRPPGSALLTQLVGQPRAFRL